MRVSWTSYVTAATVVSLVCWSQQPAEAQTAQEAGTVTSPAAPSGPTPRLPNGRPDLTGIWQRPYVPSVTQPRAGHKGPSELPYTSAGLEDWWNYDPADGDYTANCMPFGLPRSINGPWPMRIMHNETHLAFLFELGNWFNIAPVDGSEHPEELEPTWYGHSIGRWEGDTLVIDTVGFNGWTRLDTRGHPHSDALHLIQTYERIDADHINYTITVDDPKTYSAPWTNERVFTPFDGELMEYVCNENNRSLWEGRLKFWTPPWRDQPPQ